MKTAPWPDWIRLATYVRALADQMELRDWTIRLSIDTLGDDYHGGEAEAMIEPLYGRKFATLRVSDQFRGLQGRRQRYVIVHELAHLLINPIYDEIDTDAVRAQIGMPAWQVLNDAMIRRVELAIDSVAQAIAPRFTEPEWRRKPRAAWLAEAAEGEPIDLLPFRV